MPARSSMRSRCRCASWPTRRAIAARPARQGATRGACCALTSSTRSRFSPCATPEQAPDLLVEMTGRAEALIAGLGLPYRIIEICTGDMGQSHHRSFDIEVLRAGQRRLARGVVDLVVQRLPVAACRHPISGRRPERYADRSHAQRVRPRSSAVSGQRSSRTIAIPTARSSCPTCCIHTCAGVERITGR